MEKTILEFGRLLRKHGLDVSFTQIRDAVKAVTLTGLERDRFYHALRGLFVTERAELETFNKVFDFFFSRKPIGKTGEIIDDDREGEGTFPCQFQGSGSGTGSGWGRHITNGTAQVERIDFYRLDRSRAKDMEAIKQRIEILARRLAVKHSRRYIKAKKDDIDFRRTVRSAFHTAGVPLSLKYRARENKKPELVLLCDVSRSVAPFSEFMLQLIYVLQNKLRSVRSFFFVDLIDEVTDYFLNKDYDQGIQEALDRAQYSRTGVSDFGKVFAMFVQKYLAGIPARSTVIILADARNNLYPDQRTYLEIISNHVRRVIWLNPQPRNEWDREDNIMSQYAHYCHRVLECRNLKQLEDIVNSNIII